MRRHFFKSIAKLKYRLIYTLFLSGFCQFCYAENKGEYPSSNFLEFLVEFDSTDDETFEMMMENGIRDIEEKEMEKTISLGSLKERDGSFREHSKQNTKDVNGDKNAAQGNEE